MVPDDWTFTDDERNILLAAARLGEQSGASGFEMGHDDGTFYVTVTYADQDVKVTGTKDPVETAFLFAVRTLRRAMCRCGRRVGFTVDNDRHCLWQLIGAQWQSRCKLPPMRIDSNDTATLRSVFHDLNERGQRDGTTDG